MRKCSFSLKLDEHFANQTRSMVTLIVADYLGFITK